MEAILDNPYVERERPEARIEEVNGEMDLSLLRAPPRGIQNEENSSVESVDRDDSSVR